MKKLVTVLLIALTTCCLAQAQPEPQALYPILQDKLWGYMDAQGQVVIAPQFHSVGQFSEGLAPARLNGTFGFINKTGNYVLAPNYDVAYPFDNGLAKVYVDGKPYYIDHSGTVTFKHNFKEIYGFGAGEVAVVVSQSDSYGLIDRQGRLVLDTIYQHISSFSNGLALVRGKNDGLEDDGEEAQTVFEKGVVNEKGSFIIPFGKYKFISPFMNGYARVELNVKYQKGLYDHEGIIDTAGTLLFVVPAKKWGFDYGQRYFSEGLATIAIHTVDPDTLKSRSSSERYDYKGVINNRGEIVFSNKNWDKITPFQHGRAFIKDVHEHWYLIDKAGHLINKEPFERVFNKLSSGRVEPLFQQGVAFVKTKEGWGAIDTTGRFVVTPRALAYDLRSMNRSGAILFFQEEVRGENDNYYYQYGFWNTATGAVVAPQFHEISFFDFTQDLVYVRQDDRMGYINQAGNYIWREAPRQPLLTLLNIDYMNRGSFYASSPYKEELANLGGWGGSKNQFRKISNQQDFQKGRLGMVVRTNEMATYEDKYQGMKLYVVNTTRKQFFFDVQDSRLDLKIQAKDKAGNWRDIEYLPSSWCGNSYHTLFLPASNYWEFVIPVYSGSFKTQLRAQLHYKKKKNQQTAEILYSNEFEGSINPGQFWQKLPYYPAGLMDPYDE